MNVDMVWSSDLSFTAFVFASPAGGCDSLLESNGTTVAVDELASESAAGGGAGGIRDAMCPKRVSALLNSDSLVDGTACEACIKKAAVV